MERSPLHQNASVARLDQARQNAQERALAGPAAAQQRHHFSRSDVQSDFFQHGLFAAGG